MMMGRKPLRFQDAVTLLGGKSRAVAMLSELAGATLSVASAGSSAVLNLFSLKDELERLSQDAVVTLRNRISKLSTFKKIELLEAAHAVLGGQRLLRGARRVERGCAGRA